MIKETVAIEEAIALLNSALEADRDAMSALIATRVRCNMALAEHPTIQTGADPGRDGEFRVGLLGIINGLFGIEDDTQYGAIAAVYGGTGVIRFERYRAANG